MRFSKLCAAIACVFLVASAQGTVVEKKAIGTYAAKLRKELIHVYKMSEEGEQYREILLRRMSLDFNNDGLNDLALGDSFHEGNAGLFWEIFLGQPSGDCRYLGRLFYTPQAFNLQPLESGRSRFYAFHHMGEDDAMIEEYIISASGIVRFKSRQMKPNTNEADKEECGRLFRTGLKENGEENCYLHAFLGNKNIPWVKVHCRTPADFPVILWLISKLG
ncbi:MAG: hypothetical protein E4H23_10920 [Chrysiogenales bacterium]|nr:hypothetical protein [Candidatus Aminicenantes bacterium]TFG75289.1 MAG: hypothetical protein E4H23_10920 [Chrysiogenales bacterium]